MSKNKKEQEFLKQAQNVFNEYFIEDELDRKIFEKVHEYKYGTIKDQVSRIRLNIKLLNKIYTEGLDLEQLYCLSKALNNGVKILANRIVKSGIVSKPEYFIIKS